MNFLKSMAVAFSLYSKIPMPHFDWNEKSMRWHLVFFPWIGAVIGLLMLGFFGLIAFFEWDNEIFQNLIFISIPILVTGGFHLDGFMDTMDAVHSYQSPEKKLEILKDPHIGAFSVISLALYFLIATAFSFEIKTVEASYSVMISFFISRCLSGISVLKFPKAKKDGMLADESRTQSKNTVFVMLLVQLVAACVLILYITLPYRLEGIFSLMGIFAAFIYYRIMSVKNFGGVTGDTAGFFVCLAELFALIGAGIPWIFFHGDSLELILNRI